MMVRTTKLSHSGVDSLRTIFPKPIAEKLGLKIGDRLCWVVNDDDPDTIIVKKTE